VTRPELAIPHPGKMEIMNTVGSRQPVPLESLFV
jgi:hypothetical protein